jgi:uncharacterized protein (DUF1810 family)
MQDSFNLCRFVDAQSPIFENICAELRAGRKRNCWMWFTFPQIEGLGSSSMASHYAIYSAEEARAYLEHPILGPRLKTCVSLVMATKERSSEEIFGDVDSLKFCSSMTLFAHVSSESIFQAALDKFFGGKPDSLTISRLWSPEFTTQ